MLEVQRRRYKSSRWTAAPAGGHQLALATLLLRSAKTAPIGLYERYVDLLVRLALVRSRQRLSRYLGGGDIPRTVERKGRTALATLTLSVTMSTANQPKQSPAEPGKTRDALTHTQLEEGSVMALDFGKLDKVASKKCDVVPVVVQDSRTGAVLIAAYVNAIALAETMKQRVVCLWSTSRNELWVKGATSGDTLDLDEVRINCEQNSLLFLCTPRRKGACHTKDPVTGISRVSCYYRRVVEEDGGLALSFIPSGEGSARTVRLRTAGLFAVAAAAAAALITTAALRRR